MQHLLMNRVTVVAYRTELTLKPVYNVLENSTFLAISRNEDT